MLIKIIIEFEIFMIFHDYIFSLHLVKWPKLSRTQLMPVIVILTVLTSMKMNMKLEKESMQRSLKALSSGKN